MRWGCQFGPADLDVILEADKLKVFHRFGLLGDRFFPRVFRAFSASAKRGLSDRWISLLKHSSFRHQVGRRAPCLCHGGLGTSAATYVWK
ncbi:unnamed protein product [Prunus armeniaca]